MQGLQNRVIQLFLIGNQIRNEINKPRIDDCRLGISLIIV